MPKKMSQYVLKEQPLNWKRSIVAGMISTLFMTALINLFYLTGVTPFSYEIYLGSLIRGTQFGNLNWVPGLLANLAVGGVFGIFYSYCFEFIYYRSSPRLGVWLGFWHTLAAGVAFFPFFGALHETAQTGLYPSFGILGYSLGLPTFLLIILGHLLFGASMGTLYGPVRLDRVLTLYFEPGEVGIPPQRGGKTREDDPEDRIAV